MTLRIGPTIVLTMAVLGAAAVFVAPAAFADKQRASPHEKVTATVGGKAVTIEYGRPFKKGRELFGALVPWDKVWRTGADEATTLVTETDLTIGDLAVPKGSYALFTVPGQKGWQLIINKNAKQWGAFSYDAKSDVGKTLMTVAATPAPVEQLTMALVPAGDKKVTLQISWDKTVASVAVTAK